MLTLPSSVRPRRFHALKPWMLLSGLCFAFAALACGGGGDAPPQPGEPAPVISEFKATPSSIASGESSTLTWVVTNATSLSINQNVGPVTGTSVSVSPTASTVYTLTATGPGGTKTATASVSVPIAGNAFLKADGINLKNNSGAGSVVVLRGTNLGGWLLQENWMSPLGANDEYTLRNTLTTNLGASTCESLIGTYQDTWIQSWDLDQIQSMGLNMVRVPIYYLDLVTDTGSAWAWKPNPWTRLDWLVSQCSARGIYVLLDLHGAPGAQNKWDNSGRSNSSPQLWGNAYNEDLTNEVWRGMAEHFNGNGWVAGYDLLNEPDTDSTKLNTLYDRLYKTIRAIDPDHAIFLEAFMNDEVANPSTMGWTNVVYEFHAYAMGNYGPSGSGLNNMSIWSSQWDMANAIISNAKGKQTAYGIPVYVGEFCLSYFNDVWAHCFAKLNAAGVNWSPWTYKVKGGDPANLDVSSNWGLYLHGTGTAPAVTGTDATQIENAWKTWDTQTHFTPNTAYIDLMKAYSGGSTTEPVDTTTYYSIQVGGKYVSCDANAVPFAPLAALGDNWDVPMVANRASASTWEAFELINNADGTISIRAKFDGQIVTADGNHGGWVMPGRFKIQGWEKFTKTDMGGGTFSLRSGLSGSPYVAVDATTGALIANSATPVAFTFTAM